MSDETDTQPETAPETDADIMNPADAPVEERRQPAPKTPADRLQDASLRWTGLCLAAQAVLVVLAAVSLAVTAMRPYVGFWLALCVLLMLDFRRRFRAFAVVREFIRHPPSVFWIHTPESGPLSEVVPFRWFHSPRALVFHPVSGAAPAVVTLRARHYEEVIAYCRERNPEAVAFSPELR